MSDECRTVENNGGWYSLERQCRGNSRSRSRHMEKVCDDFNRFSSKRDMDRECNNNSNKEDRYDLGRGERCYSSDQCRNGSCRLNRDNGHKECDNC
ncbi:hypothetical protein BDF19DRAFT_432901, partial [Syncephalis fuscata]